MKNADYDNKLIVKLSDNSNSCTLTNQQNTMNYQVDQIKSEPQEFQEYLQQSCKETNQSFKSNNEQNMDEINPYQHHQYEPDSEQFQNNGVCLPNPMPSSNIKRCEKCGFICDSMNQITDHINNCHQSTIAFCNITNHHNYNMLSDDKIIKTETEILDLNLYEVQVLHVEENTIQFETNQITHKSNQQIENDNKPMFNTSEEQRELEEYPISNTKINEHSLPKSIWKSNNVLKQHSAKTNCLPDPAILPIISHQHPNGTHIHVDTQVPLYSPIENIERSTMITAPHSTSTDWDKIPKTSSSNNSNLITADNTPISSELKTKNGEKKKPFSCSFCGKEFGKGSDLNRHKVIHSTKKTYKCDQCLKQFIRKSNLTVHMYSHTKKKPFICSICEKEFATKHSLNTHTTIHSHEKPHKCDQCSKQFHSKVNLMKHVYVHTGKKPFSCRVCGKEFLIESYRNKHEPLHSRGKTYKCKHCQKRFTTESFLMAHMYLITGKKPYNCNLCEKGFITKRKFNHHKTIHRGESHINVIDVS